MVTKAPIVDVIAKPGAVLFVDGDKGGVGKSWTSCITLDWMRSRGMNVAAIDADTRNPDVARMFGDAIPVLNANLRTHAGWMDMLDFLVEHPTKTVVVSMPAGIGEVYGKEIKSFLSSLEMLGRPLGMFWVMNRQADSVNLLNQALAMMGDKLAFRVAVKNLLYGESEKFIRWETSETKKRFEKAGGVTIDITELHERTVDKLLGNNDAVMPFTASITPVADVSQSVHHLTPSENMELIGWVKDNHTTLEDNVGSLLPK